MERHLEALQVAAPVLLLLLLLHGRGDELPHTCGAAVRDRGKMEDSGVVGDRGQEEDRVCAHMCTHVGDRGQEEDRRRTGGGQKVW